MQQTRQQQGWIQEGPAATKCASTLLQDAKLYRQQTTTKALVRHAFQVPTPSQPQPAWHAMAQQQLANDTMLGKHPATTAQQQQHPAVK
jgi:hypothetical protein